MFDLTHGLRVLDLGRGVSGPYCGKLLLDAGADVVRVEPREGDPLRAQGPFVDGSETAGASFAFCQAGKRSVVLDVTDPDDAERLWQLIAWADVLVENEQPGVLEGHGFGAEAVLAEHPSLVYVSITPYGQSGPLRDWAATELTIGAACGVVELNGAEEREPIAYPGHMMAVWGGAAAAMGALAAYRHARLTGEGQHVDVSMLEALATCHFLFYADYEYTGALQPRGQRELIEASDGELYLRWLGSPAWDEFAVVMDALELSLRPELNPPQGMSLHTDEVMRILEQTTKTQPRQHWLEVRQEHGFLTGIVRQPDEVFACPHLGARSFFDELAVEGGATVPFPGVPYRVNNARPNVVRSVARLGSTRRRSSPSWTWNATNRRCHRSFRGDAPPSRGCASSTTECSRPARCRRGCSPTWARRWCASRTTYSRRAGASRRSPMARRARSSGSRAASTMNNTATSATASAST